MKTIIMLLLISFTFGQMYIPETDKPDYSIPKPHYEYVIFWQTWDGSTHEMYGMSITSKNPKWKYHSKGFENLAGLIEWINTPDYYGWDNEKRVRLSNDRIIAIYDLTRAKKIKLKLHSEEIIEPYKVEIKEKKWTNHEWRIKE